MNYTHSIENTFPDEIKKIWQTSNEKLKEMIEKVNKWITELKQNNPNLNKTWEIIKAVNETIIKFAIPIGIIVGGVAGVITISDFSIPLLPFDLGVIPSSITIVIPDVLKAIFGAAVGGIIADELKSPLDLEHLLPKMGGISGLILNLLWTPHAATILNSMVYISGGIVCGKALTIAIKNSPIGILISSILKISKTDLEARTNDAIEKKKKLKTKKEEFKQIKKAVNQEEPLTNEQKRALLKGWDINQMFKGLNTKKNIANY